MSEVTRVAVERWTMHSDAGYVPSDGWADVFIIPADDAARYADHDDWLYEICREDGSKYDGILEDTEPIEWHNGACNYHGHKGTIVVPDGKVAVQLEYRNISTADGVYRSATILNEESLVQLYRERAARYEELIADFLVKKASFKELKQAIG